MIRDMEELLNQIRDYEIRDYMKEALYCYNSKSYKASIMLSMSAGMYDLHNKIKVLAPVIPECRRLDEDIERMKDQLNPYEKFMVEKCSSDNIGILSSSEALRLEHYRDIRNLCSHPSGHKSSPEEARLVFSGVIDILLSKPPLLGMNHKSVLFEQLSENTFFPNNNIEIVEKIVKQKVDMIHPSSRYQIAKFLIQNIKESHNNIEILETKQIENTKIFISYMYKFCDIDISNLIQVLISDNMCTYDLLDIIYINPDILRHLEDIDIIKIISKIETSLDNSDNIEDYIYAHSGFYISDIIYNIAMLDHSIENCDVSIILDCIFKVKDYNMRTSIIEHILNNDIDRDSKEYLCECAIKDLDDMSLSTFFSVENIYLRKILELLEGEENLVKAVFNKINLELESSDFYYQNNALEKLATIDDIFKSNIEGQLAIEIIINITNGAFRGAYKCIDIVKGENIGINLIIKNSIEQITNSSENLNYTLSKLISVDNFIKLLINNEYKEELNILIEKINNKELILDMERISERILNKINEELQISNIQNKINL